MFLRRVTLENVRSIERLDLSFEGAKPGAARQWTYLLGENGAGKSTVLRAVAAVLAGGEALPTLLGDPDSWIRLGADRARITLDVATQRGAPRSFQLAFVRGAGLRRFLADNKDDLEQLDAAIARAERNYFTVGYGVARRRSGDNLSAVSKQHMSRAANVATLFSTEAHLVSIEQWAMDLDYRRGPEGLRAVESALDTLLPEATFDRIDRENRQILFETKDGPLPLSALSEGYQAMAAWCGDLLFRITETFRDHKNPLNASGLLLIDEIDLHLHPSWQRLLVSFLKRTLPRFQVLATTHSPLTVHQASEGELFVLRREAETLVPRLHRFEGAPNRMLLHQLLQSPIFGLQTLDSPQVEKLRDELRKLKGVADAPVPEVPEKQRTQRIREIRRKLADTPSWREVPRYLEHTNALMEQIAAELMSGAPPDGDGPPSTVGRAVRRGARRRPA